MLKPATILKGVCILIFLIIAILNLVSILTYWRNVHYLPWVQSDIYVEVNKKNVSLVSTIRELDTYAEDDVFKKVGIINHCKTIPPDGVDGSTDCTMPDGTGFVGDTSIVAMLCLAFIIYCFNIFVMIVAMLLRAFPPKLLYILPLTCLVAAVFMIISIVIAAICRNIIYAPWYGGTPQSSDYEIMGDYIVGPSPNKITFAEGFYINIVNTVFSLLTIGVVGFAAYKSVKDEKNANVTDAVVIEDVKVEAVKANAPPPTSSDSK